MTRGCDISMAFLRGDRPARVVAKRMAAAPVRRVALTPISAPRGCGDAGSFFGPAESGTTPAAAGSPFGTRVEISGGGPSQPVGQVDQRSWYSTARQWPWLRRGHHPAEAL